MSVAAFLPIASFAVSSGAAVLNALGQVQQNQAARAQAEYQNRLAAINAENTRRAAIEEYSAIQAREAEEAAARNQQRVAVDRESRLRTSAEVSRAASAGVTGLSVERLLAEQYAARGEALDAIEQNFEFTIDQLQREKEGVRSTTANRIASVPRAVVPPSALASSLLATAFRVGGAGIDSYRFYRRAEREIE
jgi:hypothetical protein